MATTPSANIGSVLNTLRNHFERLYGDRLVQVVLYGSHARGDAQDGSDIDVLVVLKGEVSPCTEIARTERQVADVSLINNVAVACVFVSEEQYEQEHSPLLLNIRREGLSV